MSRDAAAEKVKAHLEEKYGEEFVIEASGGGFGTADNTTWKVIFHPASEPSLRSFATIPKNGGDIKDYYTGVRAARDYSESITAEVAALAEGRVVISSGVNSSSQDGEVGGPDITLKDFLKENQDASVVLGVLTDASATKESEDALVARIGELVKETVPKGRVYLAVVDSATYDEMSSSADSLELQDIESRSNVWIVITESRISAPERL